MKTKFIIALLSIVAVTSCKKNELDGKSVIKGNVVHHSKSIPNARVFIKFGAKEFPGNDTTKYDAKLSADASGKFEVNVYKGNYYIYSVGIETGLANPVVTGGVPVKIRHKEVADITVPVSDQH